MLQGTFDTLALTEVLGLLAQSAKTGALWLEAGSVQGRIYLADGRCCAAETTELTSPVRDETALSSRLVDVCFTLARQPGGSFRFAAGEEATWRVEPGVDVDGAIADLDRLLDEWREIQLVIPSLDVRPRLAPELGTDEIILDQERWRLLVMLDGHRSVRGVMEALECGVLEVCNTVKELVEQGAVEILAEAPLPPAAAATTAPSADAGAFAELMGASAPVDDAAEALERAEAIAGVVTAAESETPGDFDEAHPNSDDEEAAAESMPDEAAAPVAEMPDPFAGADDQAEPFPGREDALGAPAGAGHLDEVDPRDRGALLRLFSALRDT